MTRRRFHMFAALSLLLCVAIATVWVRSYWRNDELVVWTQRGAAGVWASRGRLYVQKSNCWGNPARVWAFSGPAPADDALDQYLLRRARFHRWGFVVAGDDTPAANLWLLPALAERGLTRPQGTLVRRWVVVPLWTLLLPLALWAVPFYRMRRAARRKGKGRCLACGYDLRATPERCPECGQEPHTAKTNR